MHIPDGFLDPTWALATTIIALLYAFIALRRVKRHWSPERGVAVSVIAAAIFVAQMLNWPLPGGTSLHFVGGALAGILFGPWLGFLAMALVILVQTLVFHDGGITALGANLVNMAIIDVLVGYTIYGLVIRVLGETRRARLVAGFLAGWLGITLAGIACGIEIGLSAYFIYGLTVTIPVMGIWHAVLGVIEGIATAFIVDYLATRAPHYFAIHTLVQETYSPTPSS